MYIVYICILYIFVYCFVNVNFRSELGKSVNTDEAAALGKIIIIRNRVLTHVTIKKEIPGIYWYFLFNL